MTKPRSEQVSLEATSFYHCYVRCVRRAYLCGEDHSTGASYEHRKQWIVSRLRFLSYVYAISSHTDIHTALPFTREDYLDLVDKTGRAIRDDKRGFIPADVPPIISRLGINPDRWLEHIQCFGKRYAGCAGSVERIQSFADRHERHWCKGIGSSKFVYDREAA